MKNYYKILGIAKTANSTEIKKAFHKRVKETHPDNNLSDPYANEKMAEINEAYEILSNPIKRQNYDSIFNQSKDTNTTSNSNYSNSTTSDAKAKDPRWKKGNIIIAIIVIIFIIASNSNSSSNSNTAKASDTATPTPKIKLTPTATPTNTPTPIPTATPTPTPAPFPSDITQTQTYSYNPATNGTYNVTFTFNNPYSRSVSIGISQTQFEDPGSVPDTTGDSWTFTNVPALSNEYVNMKAMVNGSWSNVGSWTLSIPSWTAPVQPIYEPYYYGY